MRTAITLLILCLFGQCFAQKKQHSYITDREFHEPSDLIGYIFRPNMYEVPYQEKRPIKAGDYVFSITKNKLYVQGNQEIEGVYDLNNIKPAEYGFKLLFMNAHYPSEQGHLKVILNDDKHVDALIFRRSQEHKEVIYFQAIMSEGIAAKETEYFTDDGELVIDSENDLWGTSFRPFFRVFGSGLNERIYPADSVKINFIKRAINQGKELQFNESGQPFEAQTVSLDDAFVAKGGKAKKIQYEHFVEVRSYVTFDSGLRNVKVWKYPIVKIQPQADRPDVEGNRRYYYQINVKKADPLYVYVSPDHAVQSIEIEGITYTTRRK